MVSEAIKKADVLIEALNWIQRFRGKYVVIKFGGSALEETEAVKAFLTDVIFMSSVGMKPILIHGGGKAISQADERCGHRAPICSGTTLHGRKNDRYCRQCSSGRDLQLFGDGDQQSSGACRGAELSDPELPGRT